MRCTTVRTWRTFPRCWDTGELVFEKIQFLTVLMVLWLRELVFNCSYGASCTFLSVVEYKRPVACHYNVHEHTGEARPSSGEIQPKGQTRCRSWFDSNGECRKCLLQFRLSHQFVPSKRGCNINWIMADFWTSHSYNISHPSRTAQTLYIWWWWSMVMIDFD